MNAQEMAKADFAPVGSGRMRCVYCGGVWDATMHSRTMHVRSKTHRLAKARGVLSEATEPVAKLSSFNKSEAAKAYAAKVRAAGVERVRAWLKEHKEGTRRDVALALGMTDNAAAKALAVLGREGVATQETRVVPRGLAVGCVRGWRIA